MANWYLWSGSGAADRVNSHAYALGALMVIARTDTSTNYQMAQKWVWECTTAGTSGAAAPAWPGTVTPDTTTITDGTVVWTARKPGYSSGTTQNWSWASIYSDYLAPNLAAGDTLYVAHDHVDPITGSMSINFWGSYSAPNKLLCVNRSTGVLATTGQLGGGCGSGGYSTSINGNVYVYGIVFLASILYIGNSIANAVMYFKNCTRQNWNNSGAGSIYTGYGSSMISQSITLDNFAILSLGNTTPLGLTLNGSQVEVIGGSTAPQSGYPYKMQYLVQGVNPSRGSVANFRVSGFDFSQADPAVNMVYSGGLQAGAHMVMRNCKMPAGWTGDITNAAITTPGCRVVMDNCSSSTLNYIHRISDIAGKLREETTLVRSGGASDGVTPISWRIDTTSYCLFPNSPFKTGEFVIYNSAVGTAKTVTVEILHDAGVAAGQGSGAGYAFRNDEVWLEVQYLGDTASPLGSIINNEVDVVTAPSNQPSSTATWTTTGMTTPMTQKLQVTITPQVIGFIHVRVCATTPGKTFYVDPSITVA